MYTASRATARTHFISLLIAYALTVSLFAPFTINRVQASAGTESGERANGATIGSAIREPSLNLSTLVSGQRAGVTHAPAENLPDLNVERSRSRQEPRAILPVPSTRRRCPPHNRRCNDDVDDIGQPSPSPTPGPEESPTPYL